MTSSRDGVEAGGDVIVRETATGASLHLLLVLHPPILEPDLDLSLGEYEPLRQLPAERLRDVHVGHVDALQFGQLVLRVRAPLLPRRSHLRRRRRAAGGRTTRAGRHRSDAGRPRQRRSRRHAV